jgi:hypothetical protein
MTILAPNTVLVSSADLSAFRRVWPCSGLPSDVCVAFQFDSNGLCDINWFDTDGLDIPEPSEVNQSALLALSRDAQEFLAGKV